MNDDFVTLGIASNSPGVVHVGHWGNYRLWEACLQAAAKSPEEVTMDPSFHDEMVGLNCSLSSQNLDRT